VQQKDGPIGQVSLDVHPCTQPGDGPSGSGVRVTSQSTSRGEPAALGGAESSDAVWRRSWPITGPMFSSPPPSDPVALCLAGDLRVRRFVPESLKPLVSSESDSATLAPLLAALSFRRPRFSTGRGTGPDRGLTAAPGVAALLGGPSGPGRGHRGAASRLSTRWGFSPKAHQMRDAADRPVSVVLARYRVDQWRREESPPGP